MQITDSPIVTRDELSPAMVAHVPATMYAIVLSCGGRTYTRPHLTASLADAQTIARTSVENLNTDVARWVATIVPFNAATALEATADDAPSLFEALAEPAGDDNPWDNHPRRII